MFIKKISFYAAIFLFCHSGFLQAQSSMADSVTLVVKFSKADELASIVLNFFPENGMFGRLLGQKITSKESGKIISVKSGEPVEFIILGNGIKAVRAVVYPGDTLLVTCDFNTTYNLGVTFEGPSALLSEILTRSYNTCDNPTKQTYVMAGVRQDTYIDHFYGIEGKHNCVDSVFAIYKNDKNLSSEFKKYLEALSLYEKPSSMLAAIHLSNYQNKEKMYANPEYLLWFRDVPLNCSKELFSNAYFSFLWQYFLWKNKIHWVAGTAQKTEVAWLNKMLPDVRNELKGSSLEWFLTKAISNYYSVKNYYEVDTTLATVKEKITIPELKSQLEKVRSNVIEDKKKRFAKAAREGSKAPGFYLKDSLNSNYSIETFKGKWVFLSFYDLEAFKKDSANLNKVKRLGLEKENLQLVNIYTNSEMSNWKTKLKNYPQSGVHLFCRGNWGEMLTYMYGLESYPFYVLVDPDGVIQYSRPGNYSDAFAILK